MDFTKENLVFILNSISFSKENMQVAVDKTSELLNFQLKENQKYLISVLSDVNKIQYAVDRFYKSKANYDNYIISLRQIQETNFVEIEKIILEKLLIS